ncbi:hypothetical protein Q5Y75_11110 [Ruegeria sp. 2205SS24-7]|uniref:hypothetical protein n=1 Tax=Ruegeria discodermiae TaxID=3064389 RepID=UPI0027410273|nr:hypothetical protein [Ruegeria sp. 2205SS24-7]MDP5217770.1 hypothetical protein [Ruegeria sp. 2205SS24-7]
MAEQISVEQQIAQTIAMLRAKLGVRGKTLAAALRRARHRLPKHIYKQALLLAQVEDRAAHPKLRLTLDSPKLADAAEKVQTHLDAISLTERRKGWLLGMLGGLVFNLLLLAVLLLLFLLWQGLL